MPRHEQIEFALCRVGVAHQATLGPDRVELRIAAGHQLVRINLMARIPNQPIVSESRKFDAERRHSSTTPKFDAKCALRQLTRLHNTSRISAANRSSCGSVSPCKSSGEWMVGSSGVLLMRIVGATK